ncbi:formylglycine-generating enzyme family protein [Verrucomicrobiota bacterium]
MKKLFACVLVLLVLAGVACAWLPSEWVWFTWPFAYSSGEAGWYYMNQGDTMYCLRLDTGHWLVLGALDCGLSNGWVYYAWPYGYSWEDQAWYYLNETDEQWCIGFASGVWGRFGQSVAPEDMVLVPADSFQMGDSFGEGSPTELPVHTVYVSAFYVDRYEVTSAKWDEIAGWADDHGYDISPGVGSSKPTHHKSWYECVKWCNARSEKEGRVPACYTDAAKTPAYVYRTGDVAIQNDWVRWETGYRLPTEAEWEKAGRGGASGRRFPWGDTIQHARANYYSSSSYSYDTSPTRGRHPVYGLGGFPLTSPVGSFASNVYGLYDMAGNVQEWCWDWFERGYYGTSPGTDPRGPVSGSKRVHRGGSWNSNADYCRVADRTCTYPDDRFNTIGFRAVLPAP